MIGQNNGGFGFSGTPFMGNNQNILSNNQFGNQMMGQMGYGYDVNNSGYQFQNTMQFDNGMQQNFFNNDMANQQNFPIQNSFNNVQPQQNSFFNNNFQNNSFQNMGNNNAFNTNNTQFQNNNNFNGQVFDQTSDSSSPYTEFAALPNYGENVNINQVVEQIKLFFEDKQNWKSVFDAIDNLRILNKYYPNEINDIAGMFWKYITSCLESQKTPILKNILIFIKEMFFHTAKDVRLHDDLITGIMPFILKHFSSEKKLIKSEIEAILEAFLTNCCFDSSVLVLCQCVHDKNPSISEIAFITLAKMIANIGENLPKLQFTTLETFMLTLGKTLDSAKKGNMKKWAGDLCINTCKLFGIENYYQLIQNTLGNHLDLAQHLVKAVEEKKELTGESRIKGLVQETKLKVRMSQFGGNMQQKMNPQTVLGQPMNNGGFYGNNNFLMDNINNMGGYNNGYSLNFPQNY